MTFSSEHHDAGFNADLGQVESLLKERALDATAEGVVISDCKQPDMPIIYVNRAFTEMTGYRPEDVLGRNCRFLQGVDTNLEDKKRIRRAIENQEPCMVEILNYRKDGSLFWNRLSMNPVRDEHGRTTHYIGIQSDVTRRRQAEESLRSANARFQRDLETAVAVQRAQLPKTLPPADGFRFSWRFQPCRQLAGDILNITPLDADHIAIYVLDVSGHGISAALQSFSLAQDLRSRRNDPEMVQPDQLLTRLNQKYPMDMDTGMFFTILYGVLDTAGREFRYACAGHPGPVLIQGGSWPRIMAASSYPIGVSTQPDYQLQSLILAPGDKLILYTDGVVEALSSRDVPYGAERFLHTLRGRADQSIEHCLDAVIKSLESWACHVALRDDLSLVGIEAL